MRLLHTADWHAGKTIRGRSRSAEFEAVLAEVVGIARQEGVDAVLVAGDVYDLRSPSPEADSLVFEVLLRLAEAGIPVVVIPGNHDSPLRFAALGKLLPAIGTRVVPQVVPPDQGSIVEVPSKDGSQSALIACVPFVPERYSAGAAALFAAPEALFTSYQDTVGRVLEAMATGFRPGAVNVVMAHLFTDGALLGGGERELSIGMAYAVSPSKLPGTAAYVALGHVHRPQPVPGAPHARYAGSLLQLDFGEVDQDKSVAIVEAVPGRPAAVRTVGLTAGRRLMDVGGTVDELAGDAAGDVGDAYLRVTVRCEGPSPGLAERVRQILPNALDVRLDYERAEAAPPPPSGPAPGPRERFLDYYRRQHAAEPSAELMEAFDEALGGLEEAD